MRFVGEISKLETLIFKPFRWYVVLMFFYTPLAEFVADVGHCCIPTIPGLQNPIFGNDIKLRHILCVPLNYIMNLESREAIFCPRKLPQVDAQHTCVDQHRSGFCRVQLQSLADIESGYESLRHAGQLSHSDSAEAVRVYGIFLDREAG